MNVNKNTVNQNDLTVFSRFILNIKQLENITFFLYLNLQTKELCKLKIMYHLRQANRRHRFHHQYAYLYFQ